jgi:opacity protein-like surface antigen
MVAAAVLVSATARAAPAQMVGVPVLQNAFLNPGVTLGANLAASSDALVYAGAIAWVPENEKIQLSGGFGVLDPDGGSGLATWGARAMVPISAIGTRTLGAAVFVGVGSLSRGGATETRIPLGASVGYRGMLGGKRAISAYLAPFVDVSRFKHDSVSERKTLFRVSLGVDVAMVNQVGVTLGYEWGARAPEGSPGPAGGLFGVGVSYALRRP